MKLLRRELETPQCSLVELNEIFIVTSLTTSIKHFASLNRAPGATWTEATNRKAPHKPLLLLAVLDLVHRGVITSPFIAVTGDLVELNELFNLYWRRIIPLGQTSSIAFPFSRLDREPFWELVPQPGKAMTNTIFLPQIKAEKAD